MPVVVAPRPFLTQIDPRAKIKGSRDPLGYQYIWSHFGRQVITNLTTVTNSLRSFTTSLLGFYFSDYMVEERDRDEKDYAEIFMRIEQVCAYSRVGLKDESGEEEAAEDDIRGITRVKRNLRDGECRISLLPEAQILSNQATYGLWGLYKVAAQNSKLVEDDRYRLTPKARGFVEAFYLPLIPEKGMSLIPFLQRDRTFEPTGKDSSLARALKRVLEKRVSADEESFYMHHLIYAAKPDSLQRILWEIIAKLNSKNKFEWTDYFAREELNEAIKQAGSIGRAELEMRLKFIESIESVLAPSFHLFSFALSRDGSTLDKVSGDVKKEWGKALRSLDVDLVKEALAGGVDNILPEDAGIIIDVAQNFRDGEYRQALVTLMEQNRRVMARRGGSEWISMNGDRIKVHINDEARDLPPREDVPYLWTNSYFLNSLKRIGYQIRKGRVA